MDKKQLARELRERQYKKECSKKEIIDTIPDDKIIEEYITCSSCGARQVSKVGLELAIKKARNTEHFLRIVSIYSHTGTN